MRQRRPITEMVLAHCILCIDGGIIPRETPWYTVEDRALANRYPLRYYEYAEPGDYLGLIAKETDSDALVEFHITPTHHKLRDPKWRRRVAHIERVIRVN